MHKKLLTLAVGAMLIATVGCGANTPPVEVVTGKVMYNGTPLTEATITFHPSEANSAGAASRASSGETDGEGVFRLTTNYVDGAKMLRLDGAPAGTYAVTVSKLKKKVYADVDSGPDTNDDTGGSGVSEEYFAEMGAMTEGGDNNPQEDSLISTKFRLAYETPLRDVEVLAGENNFTIDLQGDLNGTGSGTVK